jgi:catechol 2,3-dioxygenase-like lactoylglutathione lyase family enzyme
MNDWSISLWFRCSRVRNDSRSHKLSLWGFGAFATKSQMFSGPLLFIPRRLASISKCSTGLLLDRFQLLGLKLILSGPGASGSRPMPNGRQQEPGGWNRVLLQVQDLSACIAELKQAGLHFRNETEAGPGGKQIQIEDPDGNAIELFEPARP